MCDINEANYRQLIEAISFTATGIWCNLLDVHQTIQLNIFI